MAEVKQRVDSINWYTSLVSLVLTAFAAWNIEVDLNANDVVNEVIAKNWNYIVTILVPSVITISMKVYTKYKAKLLKLKDLIKSPNFITQALSVVALVTTLIGITFGSEMPQAVSDAITSGSFITLLTALVAHVLNPIWHFIKDKFNK